MCVIYCFITRKIFYTPIATHIPTTLNNFLKREHVITTKLTITLAKYKKGIAALVFCSSGTNSLRMYTLLTVTLFHLLVSKPKDDRACYLVAHSTVPVTWIWPPTYLLIHRMPFLGSLHWSMHWRSSVAPSSFSSWSWEGGLAKHAVISLLLSLLSAVHYRSFFWGIPVSC